MINVQTNHKTIKVVGEMSFFFAENWNVGNSMHSWQVQSGYKKTTQKIHAQCNHKDVEQRQQLTN